MKLNIAEWGYFSIKELFPILEIGKANQGMLTEGDECFYIGAKKEDNGVMIHCAYDENLIQKGNCIIFICNGQGSVGLANYMDIDFIGTTDIVAGYNNKLNMHNGLFISTVLCQERPKYSFGRKWKTHLQETVIKLPQTKTKKPDWNYMEEYIKLLRCKPISTKIVRKSSKNLDTKTWKNFYLHKLFKTSMGNGIDAITTTYDNPKVNYVSRDSNGNGVVAFVDEIDGENVFPAGAMSLALGGSYLGSCFIQAEPFYTAQNVAVLQERVPLSVYTKLFISTLIRNECKVKYQAFGRELNSHFRKDLNIKLPVVYNGNQITIDKTKKFSDEGYLPDWTYMEDYFKSLPYSDKIYKL